MLNVRSGWEGVVSEPREDRGASRWRGIWTPEIQRAADEYGRSLYESDGYGERVWRILDAADVLSGERKSCADHQSFAPVVPRWNPALGQDRIELHWHGWGGPIDALPPLCDLTQRQACRLMQDLDSLFHSPLRGTP
jgi:hypothetical protein